MPHRRCHVYQPDKVAISRADNDWCPWCMLSEAHDVYGTKCTINSAWEHDRCGERAVERTTIQRGVRTGSAGAAATCVWNETHHVTILHRVPALQRQKVSCIVKHVDVEVCAASIIQ